MFGRGYSGERNLMLLLICSISALQHLEVHFIDVYILSKLWMLNTWFWLMLFKCLLDLYHVIYIYTRGCLWQTILVCCVWSYIKFLASVKTVLIEPYLLQLAHLWSVCLLLYIYKTIAFWNVSIKYWSGLCKFWVVHCVLGSRYKVPRNVYCL